MKTKLLAMFVLVALLTLSSIPAISQGTEQSSAVEPSTTQIIYGLHQEPDTLNGFISGLGVSWEVISMINEPLFAVDPAGNWYPVLAQELPTLSNGGISQDGLTITIHLREDIVWSDGESFTCDDVLFTYEAVTDPGNGLAASSPLGLIDSLTCPDDYTVNVTLRFFLVGAAQLFGTVILPRHTIGETGNIHEWPFNQQPVGTGPYRLVEWVTGDHITLVKNENYRDYPAKPKADTILVRFVPPTQESLQLLRDGEVDVLWNFAPDADFQPEDEPAIAVHERQGSAVEKLVMNLADPTLDATDDPNSNPHWALGQLEVRQAIQYGIDKQKIVDQAPGASSVATSQLGSGWAQCDIEPSTYDPALAISLLETSGWTDTNGDGIRECDGCPNAAADTPLHLKIQSTAGNSTREQTEAMLVEMMKAIGVELTIDNIAPNEFFGDLTSTAPSAHGTFDILLYATGIGAEPQGVMYGFHSSQLPTVANNGNGYNYSRWIDEQTDEALQQAGSTPDLAIRKAAYQTVCERVAAGLPEIYLYDRSETHLTRSNIQGFEVNPFASQSWNVAEWAKVQPMTSQASSQALTIEGHYTVPLHVVWQIQRGTSEPITTTLDLLLDLRTMTVISGEHTISATLSVDATGESTEGEVITVAVGTVELETIQAIIPTPAPLPLAAPSPTVMPEVEAVTGTVTRNANFRAGPSTDFDIAGNVQQGQVVEMVGQNEDCAWYQLSTKQWIAAFLVDNVPGDIRVH